MDMSLQLTDVLKKVLRQRKIDTLKNGWGDVPEWVFVTEGGKPCYENYPRRIFYKVIEKAGLRKIRLHDIRHYVESRTMPNVILNAKYIYENTGDCSNNNKIHSA